MTKILVTGGCGAIGLHLSQTLINRGDTVYLADNYCRSKKDDAVKEILKHSNAHEINVDLCDQDSYTELPRNVDYVYHLAAMNGTQNFYEKPFDVLTNCTLPTIELLKYYANNQTLKRFLYAGSSEAYAASVNLFNWEVPTRENVPLGIEDPQNIRWSYGGSKLHGELATIAASKQFGLPFTIARYHNVYGPRMGDRHIIPDFLERAKKGIFELYGYKDTRSFIYVDDAVKATIMLAESSNTMNEIVNIGGEPEITMLDLGKTMLGILRKQNEIVCHESPKGSVKRRSPNLEKLYQLTQYKPEISLHEGLKKTIAYHMNNVEKDKA